MKKLLAALGIALLILGCTEPPESQSQPGYSMQNTSATSRNADVIVVRASGGGFEPITLGEGELAMLGGGCGGKERQSIYLAPSLANGRGALLEAVYALEYPEECTRLVFLGKEYSVLSACAYGCFEVLKSQTGDSVILSDGAFLGDSKWRVRRAVDDKGLIKVEVYMDGYFVDIEDRKDIELFGKSGLVFRFEATSDEPVFVVDGSRARAERPGPSMFEFVVADPENKKEYRGREIVEENGLRIVMEDPIPAMSGLGKEAKLRPLEIPIISSRYVTTCLEYSEETRSKLCLGKEKERVALNPVGCEMQGGKGFVRVGQNKYGFEGTIMLVNESADKIRAVVCRLEKEACTEEKTAMAMGERIYGEGNAAILWKIGMGQGWCTKLVEFSELEQEVVLEDGKEGVVLDWVGRVEPKLRGVYISRESPAYKILAGT